MATKGLVIRFALPLMATVLLAACGGGAETVELPVVNPPTVSEYNGPGPATDDVQAFRLNLWENIKSNNRCGGCHVADGQAPEFARNDDVNLAYEAANPIVDLSTPALSRMVEKVGNGHNCWLASDTACADILTTWISAWAGESAGTGGRVIELVAPEIKEVGQSKRFPDDPASFAATVHPVLLTYCAGCHSSASPTPQSPYFADMDVSSAYESAKPKIDLDEPSASRLVIRLRDEFHNCWSDCATDAMMMRTAIEAFAGPIMPTQVDPALVTSKALTLFDGVIASGGNRYESNTIALYEFKTGEGNVAFDTSGVEPAVNLTLSGNTEWVGGWGVDIKGGKAQGSTASSKKLHDLIKATGEYSVEAWVVPGNVTQEDARIVSYSGGTTARNFLLGQTLYNYDFANRSSATDANGEPALSTADDDEDLQATLQHVVVTYDPVEGRRIYVNAEYTGDEDAEGGGSIADWDDTFAFVLGNEVSGDRQWIGVLRLVAIHNRTLTESQIQQNFEAGVGEKFLLLFSLSHLVGVPDSYLMFEVSQFDSYAYLFNKPVFISLDPDASPSNIALKGMRIGVNGVESDAGQAWANLDTVLDASSYTENGQALSELGTIVALEKGPAEDEFFLTFDQLGTNTFVRTPPEALAPPAGEDFEAPDVGLRTFDEINATMSEITGISRTDSSVATTFATIRQQLPVVEGMGGFLASHQVAVAQLAIEYCNALVDNTAARSTFFPGFGFGSPVSTALDPAGRDFLIDPLLARAAGTNLMSQPDVAAMKSELNLLIDRLTACGASCSPDRTETVAKATCAAMLGSAVTVLQ